MLRFSNTTITILTMAVFLLASPASSGDLVRVDFVDVGGSFQNAGGIFGQDDVFICDSGSFDLIDIEDEVDDAGGPLKGCIFDPDFQGVGQSNVSGGGRWKLGMPGGEFNLLPGVDVEPPSVDVADRHAVGITFPLIPHANTTNLSACSDLGNLGLGGENATGGTDTCVCGGTCFVQLRMAADRVFKRGATRQAFSITIVEWNGTDRWVPAASINHIDPLYICEVENPDDKDKRLLQTDDCNGNSGNSEAEVSSVDGTSSSILGRWDLPLEIFLHRVPRPATDDSGGGTCESPQLPKGAVCTDDGDCCSNKCKGGATKTCK